MRKFRVTLTAKAIVTASISVEADNADEAMESAKQRAWSGDVIWEYTGAQDETIQAEDAW